MDNISTQPKMRIGVISGKPVTNNEATAELLLSVLTRVETDAGDRQLMPGEEELRSDARYMATNLMADPDNSDLLPVALEMLEDLSFLSSRLDPDTSLENALEE